MKEQQSKFMEANKVMWNNRASIHLESEFYDNDSFLEGRNSLNEIEMPYLNSIEEKRVLHLQCHFGQDTISLKRLGASHVVGVDFSEEAIDIAKNMAEKLDLEIDFILGNVMDLKELVTGEFDLIFCSYGVTGWLPDLTEWAKNISDLLSPSGRFLYAEFHPIMWMFNDQVDQVTYPYLHGDVIVEEEGTYTDGGENAVATSYGWNYGISEVVTPFLQNGLNLTAFREYDYSPYNCWPTAVKQKDGFQIKGLEGKLPMVYLIEMTKPAQ